MHATVPVCLFILFAVHTCNGFPARNATVVPPKNWRTFLSDTSFVTRQINCILGRARCDRLGGQLLRAVPEVVNRNCARCTTAQASNANKLITFIKNHYPVAYRDILKKYRNNKADQTQQNRRSQKPSRTLTSQSTANVETATATNSAKRKSSS